MRILRTGILFLLIAFTAGCSNSTGNGTESDASTKIDMRSYKLGGIGAFAEVVDIGIKKLALSSTMSEEEFDSLIDDARRIAKDNNTEIYIERDFLVTDLFAESVTKGKIVLLIYRGDVLKEYMNIKQDKQALINHDDYSGSARKEIAVRMGKLLSYPDERIEELLRNTASSE